VRAQKLVVSLAWLKKITQMFTTFELYSFSIEKVKLSFTVYAANESDYEENGEFHHFLTQVDSRNE
jgi:hypothetical protein